MNPDQIRQETLRAIEHEILGELHAADISPLNDQGLRLLAIAARREATRDARIAKALEMHREIKIYDECGHDHRYNEDGTLPEGVVEIDEIGLTCQDAHMYSICATCCTGGSEEWQTEACANDHKHTYAEPCFPCPTRAALEGRDTDGQ